LNSFSLKPYLYKHFINQGKRWERIEKEKIMVLYYHICYLLVNLINVFLSFENMSIDGGEKQVEK